jgi:hypothetical protein
LEVRKERVGKEREYCRVGKVVGGGKGRSKKREGIEWKLQLEELGKDEAGKGRDCCKKNG